MSDYFFIKAGNKEFYYSHRKTRRISKLYRDNEIKVYIKLRPSGRLHEVVEEFIVPSEDNQLYLGYNLEDGSGYFRQYATLGKFLNREEKEEALN